MPSKRALTRAGVAQCQISGAKSFRARRVVRVLSEEARGAATTKILVERRGRHVRRRPSKNSTAEISSIGRCTELQLGIRGALSWRLLPVISRAVPLGNCRWVLSLGIVAGYCRWVLPLGNSVEQPSGRISYDNV
jgi:hypothetical protein